MEILVVTLVVCMILGISYAFFRKDVKRRKAVEREKNLSLHNFYKQEIKSMRTLQLEEVIKIMKRNFGKCIKECK